MQSLVSLSRQICNFCSLCSEVSSSHVQWLLSWLACNCCRVPLIKHFLFLDSLLETLSMIRVLLLPFLISYSLSSLCRRLSLYTLPVALSLVSRAIPKFFVWSARLSITTLALVQSADKLLHKFTRVMWPNIPDVHTQHCVSTSKLYLECMAIISYELLGVVDKIVLNICPEMYTETFMTLNETSSNY